MRVHLLIVGGQAQLQRLQLTSHFKSLGRCKFQPPFANVQSDIKLVANSED